MTPLQRKEIDKLKSIFGDEFVSCGGNVGNRGTCVVWVYDLESDMRIGGEADILGEASKDISISYMLLDDIKRRPERYPSLSIKLAEHEAKEKI